MAATPPPTTPDAAADTAQEPCPTPLEWRVVVEEFRRLRTTGSVVPDDGPSINFTTFGAGLPVYILGPGHNDDELFSLLAWLLREECRAVFTDLPAVDWPVRCLPELQRQSAAVLQVANELQHEQFAVVGVGTGSAVALDLCLNAPERISALTLLQGGARLELTWLERSISTYGSLLPGTLGSLPGWRALQQRNHRPWFPPFDASRFEFLANHRAQTPIAQASRRMLLWAGLDFRAQLPELKLPTLLIRTEAEARAVSGAMQELKAALPQAREEAMHTTGMYPYLTHPHRVAKLLRTFLESASLLNA